MMKIQNAAIHAASVIAHRLDGEGRRDDAAAIYALVDAAIGLEVKIRAGATEVRC